MIYMLDTSSQSSTYGSCFLALAGPVMSVNKIDKFNTELKNMPAKFWLSLSLSGANQNLALMHAARFLFD